MKNIVFPMLFLINSTGSNPSHSATLNNPGTSKFRDLFVLSR